MQPTLHLLEDLGGRAVRVLRGDHVGDDLWLSVRSVFGSRGETPGQEINLPLEQFLARLRWLSSWPGELRWAPRLAEKAEATLRQSQLLSGALSADAVDDSLAEIPLGRFTRSLKSFQRRDVGKLVQLPHGANFSVTGGGKTAVTLACYEAERVRGRVTQLLIVAPYAAFESWNLEVRRCFSSESPTIHRYDTGRALGDAEIVIVAYQRLASAYDDLAQWMAKQPTMLVLDEAHRAKRGKAGVWGRACLDLSFLAARRDVLTGTPAPNGLGDLRSLLEFLWHSDGSRLVDSQDRSDLTPQAVGTRISPLFTRTTKAELGLPRLGLRTLSVPMGPAQTAIYAALVGTFAAEFELERRDAFYFRRLGRVVMYLLQAATNPALLRQGSDRFDAIEFRFPSLPLDSGAPLRELLSNYADHEPPQKFLRVLELVRENAASGRKTLIWSNFVRNLTSLHRLLKAFEPALIHGGVPIEGDESRETELARFRNDSDCLVLLANPQTLGEGVSLHEDCHDAVFIDRTFNAGLYLQSVDRIHRLGLEDGVATTATHLITSNSIDEVVEARLAEKMRALSRMLSDPGLSQLAMPDEEEQLPLLDSLEDIAALVSHFRIVESPGHAGNSSGS